MSAIDVRFEAEHEAVTLTDDRPMLTWGHHPIHGHGWTLWYLAESDGVEDHFVSGDLTDVSSAVADAEKWLSIRGDRP